VCPRLRPRRLCWASSLPAYTGSVEGSRYQRAPLCLPVALRAITAACYSTGALQ
jgi:hypothetical protein